METNAVSSMRVTIVHKNQTTIPPHNTRHPCHEVEECRRKNIQGISTNCAIPTTVHIVLNVSIFSCTQTRFSRPDNEHEHDDHTAISLSLMSAVRSRVTAHWSSSADCVHMIKQRHLQVTETLIMGIHQDTSPCFVAVGHCQMLLEGVGLDGPSWRSLADTLPVGARSRPHCENGWQQHRVARCLEERHLKRQVWPTLTDSTSAWVRSQQARWLQQHWQRGQLAVRLASTPYNPGCGCAGASFSPAHINLSHLLMWPRTRNVWSPPCCVLRAQGC